MIPLLGAPLVAAIGLCSAAFIGGYRLNLTPSEPLGLWRIEQLRRPAEAGDIVFICPPVTATFEEALIRGYLRRGLCAGGFAPLIKTVVALAGKRVEVGDHVVIDGRPVAASAVRKKDGEGRAIQPFSGGIVPSGTLFLHSSFASSYDSRYFGPVPDSGLLGLARPVLIFGR
ncbi:conjugative transfer signal peptidase TraF [Rhizobium acaciae]|uniref:conjugative transfer signal peptidase TraF n=1 Tax=Rhizobium acaciae TaxID=2989736 RepID=UPI003F94E321